MPAKRTLKKNTAAGLRWEEAFGQTSSIPISHPTSLGRLPPFAVSHRSSYDRLRIALIAHNSQLRPAEP